MWDSQVLIGKFKEYININIIIIKNQIKNLMSWCQDFSVSQKSLYNSDKTIYAKGRIIVNIRTMAKCIHKRYCSLSGVIKELIPIVITYSDYSLFPSKMVDINHHDLWIHFFHVMKLPRLYEHISVNLAKSQWTYMVI